MVKITVKALEKHLTCTDWLILSNSSVGQAFSLSCLGDTPGTDWRETEFGEMCPHHLHRCGETCPLMHRIF